MAARISRLRAMRDDVARRAAVMLAAAPSEPLPTRDALTADHPLSRVFGLERARQLIDPEPPLYVREAADRRALVLRLSLACRPVQEIADEVGLTYGSTVKVRGRLRREGKLP